MKKILPLCLILASALANAKETYEYWTIINNLPQAPVTIGQLSPAYPIILENNIKIPAGTSHILSINTHAPNSDEINFSLPNYYNKKYQGQWAVNFDASHNYVHRVLMGSRLGIYFNNKTHMIYLCTATAEKNDHCK